MDSGKKGKKRWVKIIPMLAMIICIAAFLLVGRSLTQQDLVGWLPQNRVLAALAIIALYAVKSLTVFFPLLTLYLLSGVIFPLPIAILVNVLGLTACDTLPYLIGKSLGNEFLKRIRAKYPKLEALETLHRKGAFPFAALARSAGMLPGDIVSVYFGCVHLNYPAYLAGSILGLAPPWLRPLFSEVRSETPVRPDYGLRQSPEVPLQSCHFWPANIPCLKKNNGSPGIFAIFPPQEKSGSASFEMKLIWP